MTKHATDAVSLAAGLVFLAIAGMWALLRGLDLTLPPLGWFLAAALVVAGGAGIIGALRQHRS